MVSNHKKIFNKRILVITDNEQLVIRFRNLVETNQFNTISRFDYAFSSVNIAFQKKYKNCDWIKPLSVKDECDLLINEYDLVISLHCKQIFPEKLIDNVKCINIHPGLNPYNRGWYPQVFSIINGLPCGATIHEIDVELDHGPIICQKEVKIEAWDTSLTAYNKILDVELELLEENLDNIINDNYKTTKVPEGNLNLKLNFEKLCQIDINSVDTFKNHLNKLRALTHGQFSNAYFIDDDGRKVFVKIELNLDS